jgi:hypothetical protein
MLERLVVATVSRRPVSSVVALGAMSVIASVMLTACDVQADQHTAPPTPLVSTLPAAEAPVASAPALQSSPLRGQAALREYDEGADPSHAAIASYKD